MNPFLEVFAGVSKKNRAMIKNLDKILPRRQSLTRPQQIEARSIEHKPERHSTTNGLVSKIAKDKGTLEKSQAIEPRLEILTEELANCQANQDSPSKRTRRVSWAQEVLDLCAQRDW